MRHHCLVIVGLGACLGAPASASHVGLPTRTFAQSWTALPTGRFTQDGWNGSFEPLEARTEPLPDAEVGPLLDAAFASARHGAERRGIAMSEMTTPWDQPKRSAFQHLRDAEAAYAGANDARHERFVATLTRLIDGSGRSAAEDGSAPAALESAYAAALGRQSGDARVATEAVQKAWRAYGAAFAAFADRQTPGSAAGVMDELQRQRASDLAAER